MFLPKESLQKTDRTGKTEKRRKEMSRIDRLAVILRLTSWRQVRLDSNEQGPDWQRSSVCMVWNRGLIEFRLSPTAISFNVSNFMESHTIAKRIPKY